LTARFIATPPPRSEQLAARAAEQDLATASPRSGAFKVIRIIRADTIELEGLGPVRLLGVESPEGKSPQQIYEAHGRRASEFTSRLLAGQEVRIEWDTSQPADSAGPKPAYIYTRSGALFNAEIIRQGHAFVRASDHCQMSDDLRAAERDAMQAMRGVWGLADGSTAAIPPVTTDPAQDRKRLKPLLPSEIDGPAATPSALAGSSSEPFVYVSTSDRMYHRDGCEYLASKRQGLPLSSARGEGYVACGRCFASTVLKAP
jgi:micrococcal nuclease